MRHCRPRGYIGSIGAIDSISCSSKFLARRYVSPVAMYVHYVAAIFAFNVSDICRRETRPATIQESDPMIESARVIDQIGIQDEGVGQEQPRTRTLKCTAVPDERIHICCPRWR